MNGAGLRSGRTPVFVGFLLAVGYPSLAILAKLGTWALLAGAPLLAAAIWIYARHVGGRFVRVGPLTAAIGLAGLLVALAVGYYAIHSSIDTDGYRLLGREFGSSDADDALDLALEQIRAGAFPYRTKTFLDNPITPLPGALLLAAPFHLLGDAALQNLFWLTVMLAGLAWYTRDLALSFVLALGVFALSPNVIYHVLQGTDYISNGIYVLVFSTMLLETERRRAPTWLCVLASVLLGIALSSRLNFLVTTPLLFLALCELRGWRRAIAAVLPCAMAFVAVTLPFYLSDPAGFSPLHTANKLNPGGNTPWAPLLIPLLGVLLSFVLGARPGGSDLPTWLRNGFIVQFCLLVSGTILTSAVRGGLELHYAHFGMLALPWGLAAFGPALFVNGLESRRARLGLMEWKQRPASGLSRAS
jgi:hypothetical protein